MATSEKSISARSVSPRARSRFRRPMSQSRHSTRFPSRARAEPTPAEKDVFPVPPLPDITAKTLVSHGRYPYLGFSRTLSNEDRTVIQNALRTAGVEEFANRRLPTLSGGERQRVFLAMLLAQNTDVVLLDEPTTYLDAHHKFELMALLSTLKAQNKAVGIVLHELPLAFKFCDRLLLMENGQIMQSGTPEELLKTGLIEHLFGVSLTPVMLDKEVEYIERKIHS